MVHEACAQALALFEDHVAGTEAQPPALKRLKLDGDAGDFMECLQALSASDRPTTKEGAAELCTRVIRAALAAGEHVPSWKLLVLAVLRRRFHAKAPQAKCELAAVAAAAAAEGSTASSSKGGGAPPGDGERAFFYGAVAALQQLAHTTGSDDSLAAKACGCLCRLAMAAGGTRDVCALIEHLTFDSLERAGLLATRREEGHGKAAALAAMRCVGVGGWAGSGAQRGPLEALLDSAAALLDADLALVRGPPEARREALPSTLHTFIPHHRRGSSASESHRKLVQLVAELQIWTRTSAAAAAPGFAAGLEQLRGQGGSGEAAVEAAVEPVHKMQTAIRRLRQELNGAARAEGFSLCTSFKVDRSSLTLRMVRRGKAGDLEGLRALASKAKDATVLGLLAARAADPDKAVPTESAAALARSWIALSPAAGAAEAEAETGGKEEDDELARLQLTLQEATVRATVAALRGLLPAKQNEHAAVEEESDAASKGKACSHLVACLDGAASLSAASAVLVAAALDARPWGVSGGGGGESRSLLFLGEGEGEELVSGDAVMARLDSIFAAVAAAPAAAAAAGGEAAAATTKQVQNLIERHVGAGQTLLLLAACDVKLEQRVLGELRAQRSTVHVHIGDQWSARMEREGAKVGDVTVTLAWDSECDLDLHAICPGGEEIYYGNRLCAGGNLDVDANGGGPRTKEPVENVFFGDAEKRIEAGHGKYRAFVRNYAYHGSDVEPGQPVKWRARLVMNGKTEEVQGECTGTGKDSDQPAFEFDYKGRIAPAPEATGTALSSTRLVAVTASLGTTVDSLKQLMTVSADHAELERVRALATLPPTPPTTEAAAATTAMVAGVDGAEAMEVEGAAAAAAAEPGLMLETFDVTNRDRQYLVLSKLPSRFHREVAAAFGGPTLLEITAASLAERFRRDDIAVAELRAHGYPDKIVKLTAQLMQTFGAEA